MRDSSQMNISSRKIPEGNEVRLVFGCKFETSRGSSKFSPDQSLDPVCGIFSWVA